jgi:hypothetical protein
MLTRFLLGTLVLVISVEAAGKAEPLSFTVTIAPDALGEPFTGRVVVWLSRNARRELSRVGKSPQIHPSMTCNLPKAGRSKRCGTRR